MTPYIFAGLPDFKKQSYRIGLPEKISGIDSLVHHVFAKLGLDVKTGLSPSRKKEYVTARMISIGILVKTDRSLTLKQIGSFFNRDHSTVVYNRDLFENLLSVNDKFLIDQLKICGFENLIP